MEAVTNWRDSIFTGSPAGSAAPPAPVFILAIMPTGSFIGIFEEFRKMVDLIKSSPGYTRAIGEDLMIVAPVAGSGDSTAIFDPMAPSFNRFETQRLERRKRERDERDACRVPQEKWRMGVGGFLHEYAEPVHRDG